MMLRFLDRIALYWMGLGAILTVSGIMLLIVELSGQTPTQADELEGRVHIVELIYIIIEDTFGDAMIVAVGLLVAGLTLVISQLVIDKMIKRQQQRR